MKYPTDYMERLRCFAIFVIWTCPSMNNTLAIGKAVRGIVDSFPNKKPLLVIKITDYSIEADMRPNAKCFMHGLDPFTMTTFRGSESLFRRLSAKAFPR